MFGTVQAGDAGSDATPFALQRVLPVDKLMGTTIIVNLAMDISSMVLV